MLNVQVKIKTLKYTSNTSMKKIKTSIITLFLVLGKTLLTLAQSSDINVTYEKGSDNSITFNYEKRVPGSYTISVKLTQVQNSLTSDYEGVIQNSSGTLFKIRPQRADEGITFSYNYSYVQGNLTPKVDTTFIYALPFKRGKNVTPIELSFIGKTYFKDAEPKNWKAYRFTSKSLDTACAVRKGIVVKIENRYPADTTQSFNYTSKQNTILIEHEDGSMAFYAGFQKNEIWVKEGDMVYPQTSLGILSKYDIDKNYNLSVQVYFFSKIKMSEYLEKSAGQKLSKQHHFQEYINPTFLTTEGRVKLVSRKQYVAEMNEETMMKEFTKREIKNYKKGSTK
jgi:hypothetical protein